MENTTNNKTDILLKKIVSSAFNMAILLLLGSNVITGAIVYLIGYLLSK